MGIRDIFNDPIGAVSYSAGRSATSGALFGAAYAYFANLPVKQAAIAYGVCCAAATAITLIAAAFSIRLKRTSLFVFTLATTGGITSLLAIQELRKRGLMGDKLLIVSLIMDVLVVATLFGVAIRERIKGN